MAALWGYNACVPPPTPRPPTGKSRILRTEATGVIIIAVLVLAIIVVRYWRSIPWSAR